GHFDPSFRDEDVINFNNVIAVNFHSKRPCTASHRFADIADADHAEGTLAQRFAWNLFPFAAFHFLVHPRLAAGEGEHVAEDGVRYGSGEGVGGASNLHAVARAG